MQKVQSLSLICIACYIISYIPDIERERERGQNVHGE